MLPFLFQKPLEVSWLHEVQGQVPLQEVPPQPSEAQVAQQVVVPWQILLQKVLFKKQVAFERQKKLRVWEDGVS